MRLLSLLPLAAMGLQAPIQSAPIQRRQTARAAFSFSEAADSLKLDEASSKAADAAATWRCDLCGRVGQPVMYHCTHPCCVYDECEECFTEHAQLRRRGARITRERQATGGTSAGGGRETSLEPSWKQRRGPSWKLRRQ